MKKKTCFRFLAMVLTMCLVLSGFTVLAEDSEQELPAAGLDVNIVHGVNSSSSNAEEEIEPLASSLIAFHNVSLERKTIDGEVVPGWCIVSALTQCNDIMGKIGFSTIELIRTDPTTGSETTIYCVTNYMYEDASVATYEHQIFIDTGYYYHIKVIHYAKESGWLFPQTQTIEDYTGKMYF